MALARTGGLLPNAAASAGDDDVLAREVGDVLYVKSGECPAEPGLQGVQRDLVVVIHYRPAGHGRCCDVNFMDPAI